MNILIVTYSFPPSTASSSVRWFKFFELSQKRNINFTILCANWSGEKIENENIKYIGDELNFKLSKSIVNYPSFYDLIFHPTLSIRSFSKTIFSDWYRGCKNWINQNSYLNYDLIISSYGPISSVLIGNYAKKTFKAPLIIDLRDLISIQGQKVQIPIIHQLDMLLDKYFTRHASEFITVTPTCAKKAKNFYKKNVTEIYNGFSIDLNNEKINLSVKSKILNILYFGTLGVSRSPYKILRIFESYCEFNRSVKINVNFASQDDPNDYLNNYQFDNIGINWLGYLTKGNLEKFKKQANILLLLEDQNSKGDENLTGKIYEYFELKKPIIVSCSSSSDIVNLIEEVNFGKLINSKKDLDDFLNEDRYIDIETINSFNTKNQFTKLELILKKYK